MAKGTLNKVSLIGNLGADPVCKSTSLGDKVATLSLATTEAWIDKTTGEMREKTEWHRVVLWRGLAEISEKWLKKGKKIFIEGRLETRKWQDQTGADRWTTEIIGDRLEMLGDAPGQNLPPEPKVSAYRKQEQVPLSSPFPDDDIPF